LGSLASRHRSNPATTSVALLRGVNVGGHRRLVMVDVTTWLREAGFTDVTTYLQSGNVIVTHASDVDVAASVAAVLRERTGLDIAVIGRSARELSAIRRHSPYRDVGPTHHHVAFFREPPDADAVAVSAARDWGDEEFVVRGAEAYLHLPHGMGRSTMVPRLTWLAPATVRNWSTVTALDDRASAPRP